MGIRIFNEFARLGFCMRVWIPFELQYTYAVSLLLKRNDVTKSFVPFAYLFSLV